MAVSSSNSVHAAHSWLHPQCQPDGRVSLDDEESLLMGSKNTEEAIVLVSFGESGVLWSRAIAEMICNIDLPL